MTIPEKIFKIAKDNGGVPFDFREDDNEIVIVMTDGRKLIFEKEQGARKRIQQAEAEFAEGILAAAESTYAKTQLAMEQAYAGLQKAKEYAKSMRAIADGKAPAAPEPEAKKGKGK